jgi:hypothetical protein
METWVAKRPAAVWVSWHNLAVPGSRLGVGYVHCVIVCALPFDRALAIVASLKE